MLGRLRMSITQCREAYEKLASEAFLPVNYSLRPLRKITDKYQAKPEFDVRALENAIRKVIATHETPGASVDDSLLKDMPSSSCKIFVTTTNEKITETELLRSYRNRKRAESWYNECSIFQACRATSAASTFFPPMIIQGDTYIDGGLLSNNPVHHVHQEAMDIWPGEEHLLISIGTGENPKTAFNGNLKVLAEALSKIATETHRTAEVFRTRNGNEMSKAGLYYRFNVPNLGSIGLEEWRESSQVRALTRDYVNRSETCELRERCVEKLSNAAKGKCLPLPSQTETQMQMIVIEDFA